MTIQHFTFQARMALRHALHRLAWRIELLGNRLERADERATRISSYRREALAGVLSRLDDAATQQTSEDHAAQSSETTRAALHLAGTAQIHGEVRPSQRPVDRQRHSAGQQ